MASLPLVIDQWPIAKSLSPLTSHTLQGMPHTIDIATRSIELRRCVMPIVTTALSACSGAPPREAPHAPDLSTTQVLTADAGTREVSPDTAGQPVTPEQLAALLSPTGTLRPFIHRKLVAFDVDSGLVNVVCEDEARTASATWDRILGLQAQAPQCLLGKNDYIGCAVLTRGAAANPFLALTFRRSDSRLVGVVLSQTGRRPEIGTMLERIREVHARLDGPEN